MIWSKQHDFYPTVLMEISRCVQRSYNIIYIMLYEDNREQLFKKFLENK